MYSLNHFKYVVCHVGLFYVSLVVIPIDYHQCLWRGSKNSVTSVTL